MYKLNVSAEWARKAAEMEGDYVIGAGNPMGYPPPHTREYLDFARKHPALDTWCVLAAWRGSVSHGTYRPSSEPNSIDDLDLMAVSIPPIECYYGLKPFIGHRGTKEIKEGAWDVVAYEMRKFVSLLKRGNPNVISMLWLPDVMYVKKSDIGNMLLRNRELFLSKDVYSHFVGYAKAQLHKMEHCAFQGYMGEKRKALVEKHGYDTKNASHLIRLMRMGVEYLEHREFFPYRDSDADELVSIKRGEWTVEKIKAEAELLFKKGDELLAQCKLPDLPDDRAIDSLLVRMLKQHFQ